MIRRFASVALVILLALPAAAQTSTLPTTTSVEPNIYPPALPLRKGPKPPALAFHLLGEVALPGPLPAGAPRLVGDRILIVTEGGLASAEPVPGATATVEPGWEAAPTEPSPWVLSLDGKRRYRTLPEGRLEAEKRPRFGKKEWKRDWSLRLTGRAIAPPLVIEKRVCVGSLADLVTCVRFDNGHRVWATDVEDRISRPLVLWEGDVTEPATGTAPARTVREHLILVTPDSGGGILALDPYDGARRATWELPEASGKLVAEPVVTAAGTVAVPRQGYEASEAAIALLGIVVAPKDAPKTTKPL